MKYIFLFLLAGLSHIGNNFCQNLVKTGEYNLKLPNNCGFWLDAIQLYKPTETETTYLCLLYRDTRTINCYNFETKELEKTITLQAEGPDGVGYEIAAFYIENFNNIYVYSYWEFCIFIVNSNGKVKERIQLPSHSENLPLFEPGGLSPLIKVGNDLFLTGQLLSYTGQPVRHPLISFNIQSKEYKTLGRIPPELYSGYYSLKATGHFDYAADKGYFIFDVSMSDSVYLVKQGAIYSYPAKSSHIDQIPPLKNLNSKRTASKQERINYLSGNYYLGVKYDPHRQLYYRFAVKPDQLEAVYTGEIIEQTVMVLDLNLHVISEIELPRGSVADMCFVGEKGLYIANHERFQKVSDEFLSFDIYNFTE